MDGNNFEWSLKIRSMRDCTVHTKTWMPAGGAAASLTFILGHRAPNVLT